MNMTRTDEMVWHHVAAPTVPFRSRVDPITKPTMGTGTRKSMDLGVVPNPLGGRTG